MIISWVDQCDGGHDKNRRAARFDVGQNWAMQAGSYLGSRAVGASGSDMVEKWYGEVSSVSFKLNYNVIKLFEFIK